MKFRIQGSGSAKREYQAAVEELQEIMEKLDEPIRDSIATLGRMKRLRFKSAAKEAASAAQVREAIRTLAPFVAQYNCTGIAAQFRRSEALAAAVARED